MSDIQESLVDDNYLEEDDDVLEIEDECVIDTYNSDKSLTEEQQQQPIIEETQQLQPTAIQESLVQ